MVYANCTVGQGTCQDPSNDTKICLESMTCVCPVGFLMMGIDCVPLEECECYFDGFGVIPVRSPCGYLVQIVFDIHLLKYKIQCNFFNLSCVHQTNLAPKRHCHRIGVKKKTQLARRPVYLRRFCPLCLHGS